MDIGSLNMVKKKGKINRLSIFFLAFLFTYLPHQESKSPPTDFDQLTFFLTDN